MMTIAKPTNNCNMSKTIEGREIYDIPNTIIAIVAAMVKDGRMSFICSLML